MRASGRQGRRQGRVGADLGGGRVNVAELLHQAGGGLLDPSQRRLEWSCIGGLGLGAGRGRLLCLAVEARAGSRPGNRVKVGRPREQPHRRGELWCAWAADPA